MMQQVLTLFMTSKDLREIANRMEKVEDTATPGDSAIAKMWNAGNGITVNFVLDQDRRNRENH